jgi:membrane protease YdiL (CAAX protease family)
VSGLSLLLLAAQSVPAPMPLPAQAAPAPPPPPPVPSLTSTLVHMAVPLVLFALVVPLVYYFFRKTWRELDVEALEHKRALLASGEYDRRPLALFVITSIILTLQYYYDSDFFQTMLRPLLKEWEAAGPASPWGIGELVSVKHYGDLYRLAWWALTRIAGYTIIPFAIWKVLFPKDSLLDMGLRLRGFLSHAWIYIVCLAVVVPAVFIVASQPDFGNYYPFYKKSSRSWFDFVVWEALYVLQFFALEVFFRGFWLNTLRRSMGSTAIFAMTVPYCMIHYGKPYFETCGAVVAGIALGSLSMRTKSIYSGFLVHVTVALLMDFLALAQKDALPTIWYPMLPKTMISPLGF